MNLRFNPHLSCLVFQQYIHTQSHKQNTNGLVDTTIVTSVVSLRRAELLTRKIWYCSLNFKTQIPGCHYFSHICSLIGSLYFNFLTTDLKISMFHGLLFLFWWGFFLQGRHFLFRCCYLVHMYNIKFSKKPLIRWERENKTAS